jgi:tetratricopeptide (TPR) repeat protein
MTLISLTFTLLISCGQKPENKGNSSVDDHLQVINKKIADDPDDTGLLYERAKTYYENEGYDEAISDLLKAIELDSTQLDYYHLLSDVYLDYYRSKEAITTLERALVISPRSIPTLLKYSEFLLILKQHEKSMLQTMKVLSNDPMNAEAYFMQGLNFREMGDTVRTISALQKSVELDPDLVDAWLILAEFFIDRPSVAKKYYENAISRDTNNVQTIHALAQFLHLQDQLEEARKKYATIIRKDKEYIPAHFNTGIILLELDSLQRAIDFFTNCVEIDPDYSIAYYYRGYAKENLGEIEAAKADLNMCLSIDPKNQKARDALGRFE